MPSLLDRTLGSVDAMLKMSWGLRTTKLIIIYMTLSTCIILFAIYKAPDQLANAGIAVASMGAGGAAFKFSNGYESSRGIK